MREILQRPEHPTVDWSDTTVIERQTFVRVTCPDCRQCRHETAKSVAFRLRRRGFTGRCWTCSRRAVRQSEYPEHPAVDWATKTRGRHEHLVAVTCPVCKDVRWLGAKGVARQVSRGSFTGHCLADRFVGRTPVEQRPPASGVQWHETALQRETEGRRRTMVSVRCPECEQDRWCHPSHVARAIEQGTFRPECRRHRARLRLSTAARERIWQSIWLFAGREPSLANSDAGAG